MEPKEKKNLTQKELHGNWNGETKYKHLCHVVQVLQASVDFSSWIASSKNWKRKFPKIHECSSFLSF